MSRRLPFGFGFEKIRRQIIPRIFINRKKILIICTCILFCLYLVLNSLMSVQKSKPLQFPPVVPIEFQVFTGEEIEELNKEYQFGSKFLINTTGCTLPRTPIFPSFYKYNWHGEIIPICDYETILADLSDGDGILTLRPEHANSTCCLHEIARIENQADNYETSTCEDFTTSTPLNVSQKEILVTKCGNNLNFEANFVIRPHVQQKLNYWAKIPQKNHPPSVILIGVDTTSRSHVFRSLPKTLAFMKKMGFVDFKGYHSIKGEATHFNFHAFLMGLSTHQVYDKFGCNPNGTGLFDKCPFIWKDFDLQNYVTMYVENGYQYLKFGQQPTDFYIRSLFKSIEQLRGKYSPILENPHRYDCTSNETVPQFVTRYTKRFIQKFKNVPTFSFTWFEMPFHDFQFTLPTMDKEWLKFYKALNSDSDLMENTFIIFLADHGERFGPFMYSSSSTEAYIERLLPPLFIRTPKSLRNKFPNLDQTFKINSESLIATLDIHHTFKHILSMGVAASNSTANFEPVLPDRSSLFYPVSSNRTCKQLKIQWCACGLKMNPNPIVDPSLLEKLIEFAQFKLNEKVFNSKYSANCYNWTTTVDKILYSRVFPLNATHSNNLIQFSALPENAKFEVKIRTILSEGKFKGAELIEDFYRVSRYGNQSHCVSPEDRKMKELCFCK